jgi:hypothetical protein
MPVVQNYVDSRHARPFEKWAGDRGQARFIDLIPPLMHEFSLVPRGNQIIYPFVESLSPQLLILYRY